MDDPEERSPIPVSLEYRDVRPERAQAHLETRRFAGRIVVGILILMGGLSSLAVVLAIVFVLYAWFTWDGF